jgi:hypothetical protein
MSMIIDDGFGSAKDSGRQRGEKSANERWASDDACVRAA